MKTNETTPPHPVREQSRRPRRYRLRRSLRPLASGAVAAAALAWAMPALLPEPDPTARSPHRSPLHATHPARQAPPPADAARAAPGAVAPRHADPDVVPAPAGASRGTEPPAARHTTMARRLKALYPGSAGHGEAIIRVVHEQAAQHRLDPCLVMAVIARESSFRPAARNHLDTGLMQVNVDWHPELVARAGGRQALLDPERNVRAGTELLAHYRSRSRSEREALQRYHGLGKRNDYVRWVQAESRRLRAAGTCGADVLLAAR